MAVFSRLIGGLRGLFRKDHVERDLDEELREYLETRDPVSFVSAAAFLVCVALLATLFPAWRAARIDPMTALRQD